MKRTVFALIALYLLTIIAFAGLYLITPPREVVREIIREKTPEPVEKWVAPVEKMVQDTLRPLVPGEVAAAGETDLLRDLGPVRVQVIAPVEDSGAVPVDVAETAVLAVLSRKNIPVSTDAAPALQVSLRGKWDEGGQNLAYHVRVALSEPARVRRPGGMVPVAAEIWQRDQHGFLPKSRVPQDVIGEAAALTTIFADALLQAQTGSQPAVPTPAQP
ncbi:MAG: hypothetical protein SFU85_03785 [Candidatus Methylacidiphilales bacterium]|nr:hypothetical protein [Candidatus Methylacidiphilales bacterium]